VRNCGPRGGLWRDKNDLTLHLEAETVLRAKVLAARRDTSVSALVARTLDRMVEDDERYEAARQRALELMAAAGPGEHARQWRHLADDDVQRLPGLVVVASCGRR
jgi:hypothetical protein